MRSTLLITQAPSRFAAHLALATLKDKGYEVKTEADYANGRLENVMANAFA